MPMTPRLARWIPEHYPVLGEGDPRRFEEAVRLAEHDWRDLLVAAELADGRFPAHLDRLLGPAD